MNEQEKAEQQPPQDISRRDFLGIAGTMVGVAALSSAIGLSKTDKAKIGSGEENPTGPQWGMLIDINLCIGCNYCTYACQATNNLADDMRYNIVTLETTQNGNEYYLSRPCMHCEEAPCVHVCPVEATYHRPDGIVTMDYDLCIGCRYCQIACPYDVRVFNWKTPIELSPRVPEFGYPEVENRPRGVMEKCTFCQHRIDPGLERGLVPGVDDAATPACVVACPTGARVFGDLNDEHSPVSQALKANDNTIRLREELDTEPRVFYVPPHQQEETA